MMKRLISMLFFTALSFLAMLLIAPGFIDWNQHKGRILEHISPYFQRKINVAGNVSFRIIPQPEIMLSSVTVENAPGAGGLPLASVGQLGVRIQFMPLLEGRVEVEIIDLIDPVFNFEIPEGGKPNWQDILKEVPADLGVAALVRLNQVMVANGTINYTNRAAGSEMKLENLNLAISADSLLGPYRVTGNMKYRNVPVGIDIGTELYDGVSPIPVRVSFVPVGELPRIHLDGAMDIRSGFDIQGELSVDQGSLGNLFGTGGLSGLDFMRETASLAGVLELKGGQLSLSAIKAKFGKEGELQGKYVMRFSREGKPSVHIEAEGSNLAVTGRGENAWPAVPASVAGDIHFKGKNITLGGRRLAAAEADVDFHRGEWKINSAQMYFPGASQLKLSGTAKPETRSAAWAVQGSTEDLGKLVKFFAPAENNIFRSFMDAGLVKKAAVSGNFEISPSKISFFGMEGKIEDKSVFSGSVDVDRFSQRPGAAVKLALADVDTASFPPGAYDGFVQKVMDSDTDMDLTFKNLTRKGVFIQELSLKAKTGSDGIVFKDVRGSLPGNGTFVLSGRMASVKPPSGMEIFYTLKSGQPESFFKSMGAALPPAAGAWKSVDIDGEIRGDARRYTFNAEGVIDEGNISLDGYGEKNAEGHDSYTMSFHLKQKNAGRVLAFLSFPPENMLEDEGELKVSGEIKGTAENYKIDNLQSPVLSGSIGRKGSVYTADLAAGKMNLDKWLSGWALKAGQHLSLHLKGSDMLWQGQHISGPYMTMEADASSVAISNFGGVVWDGALNADLSFSRKEKGAWASSFKGTLKKADLGPLNKQLGFQGFSIGAGDLEFDLASSDGALASATGSVVLNAHNLKIERFNTGKLADFEKMTEMPENLQNLVNDSFRKNGATTFGDVQGRFKIDQGKAAIESLALSGAPAAMKVTGTADMKTGSYDIAGTLHLNKPDGFPDLKIQRVSTTADYTVDAKPIGKMIIDNMPPPPVPTQPEVAPLNTPVEALPPGQGPPPSAVPPANKNSIGDILQRLDEEEEDTTP